MTANTRTPSQVSEPASSGSPPSVRESETDSSGSSLAAVDVSPRTSAARCLELFEELPQNDQEEAHDSLSEAPKALAEIDIPTQVEDDTEISPSLASLVVGESASEVAKRSLLSFYATLESQQVRDEGGQEAMRGEILQRLAWQDEQKTATKIYV